MRRSLMIDCANDSFRHRYAEYAVVAADVIRATTTAVTGLSLGRKCYPIPSIEAALPVAARLDHPLLVGELGGNMPFGFDLNNSPAELAARTDIERPMILLSTSGTKLICEGGHCQALYVVCFRNCLATARYLVGRHEHIAVIGAPTRGEFREEDQMCCAWTAAGLIRAGYAPEDGRTKRLVEEWTGASPEACAHGKSAKYLRESGQEKDLEFILTHVNDVDEVFMLVQDELVAASSIPCLTESGAKAA